MQKGLPADNLTLTSPIMMQNLPVNYGIHEIQHGSFLTLLCLNIYLNDWHVVARDKTVHWG